MDPRDLLRKIRARVARTDSPAFASLIRVVSVDGQGRIEVDVTAPRDPESFAVVVRAVNDVTGSRSVSVYMQPESGWRLSLWASIFRGLGVAGGAR